MSSSYQRMPWYSNEMKDHFIASSTVFVVEEELVVKFVLPVQVLEMVPSHCGESVTVILQTSVTRQRQIC